MPREQMNEKQVAAYLNMDLREVQKLSARGQIPCRKIGGQFVYTKLEVDHWAFSRLGQMDHKELAGIEKGVSLHHGYDPHELSVESLIPRGGIAVPLDARTGGAVLRKLVDLGESLGVIYVPEELHDEIRKREELCSTAMVPGVALPHPRHPLPYDISDSFVLVGRTFKGVPYGAEDGTLTQLFFLICCKDERTHLHVLARLARILTESRQVEALLGAEDADALRETLAQAERDIVH
jgi:PTS system nitrogen regulatory IIA component